MYQWHYHHINGPIQIFSFFLLTLAHTCSLLGLRPTTYSPNVFSQCVELLFLVFPFLA